MIAAKKIWIYKKYHKTKVEKLIWTKIYHCFPHWKIVNFKKSDDSLFVFVSQYLTFESSFIVKSIEFKLAVLKFNLEFHITVY